MDRGLRDRHPVKLAVAGQGEKGSRVVLSLCGAIMVPQLNVHFATQRAVLFGQRSHIIMMARLTPYCENDLKLSFGSYCLSCLSGLDLEVRKSASSLQLGNHIF